MITKTIEVNGVTLTVRRATLGDVLRRDQLLFGLPDTVDALTAYYFVRAATQTVEIAGLSWQPPASTADAETLYAALDSWVNLDGEIGAAWIQALDAVQKPLNGVDAAPGGTLTETEKADPKSAKDA